MLRKYFLLRLFKAGERNSTSFEGERMADNCVLVEIRVQTSASVFKFDGKKKTRVGGGGGEGARLHTISQGSLLGTFERSGPFETVAVCCFLTLFLFFGPCSVNLR